MQENEMMHSRGFVSLRMYPWKLPPLPTAGTSAWDLGPRYQLDGLDFGFTVLPRFERDILAWFQVLRRMSMECVVNGACNRDCHTVTMR